MKKLGLLVIHGIGTSKEDYDKAFKKALFKKLCLLCKDPDEIAYAKIFWSGYVNVHQRKYFKAVDANPAHRMDWRKVRGFVMDNLSDAASYQHTHGQGNVNYHIIVKKIFYAMRSLRKKLKSDDKPLIIFAHSLGCFVISNYIWDAHRKYAGAKVSWPKGTNPKGKFEHMINLAGLVTFGCNIPLFVIGHDPIEAIRFPHAKLASKYKKLSEWHNYYDPDDVLGWPLRELPYSFSGKKKKKGHRSYADVVDADHCVQVGKLLKKLPGGTPFSHTLYWDDDKMIDPSAEQVARFL